MAAQKAQKKKMMTWGVVGLVVHGLLVRERWQRRRGERKKRGRSLGRTDLKQRKAQGNVERERTVKRVGENTERREKKREKAGPPWIGKTRQTSTSANITGGQSTLIFWNK